MGTQDILRINQSIRIRERVRTDTFWTSTWPWQRREYLLLGVDLYWEGGLTSMGDIWYPDWRKGEVIVSVDRGELEVIWGGS